MHTDAPAGGRGRGQASAPGDYGTIHPTREAESEHNSRTFVRHNSEKKFFRYYRIFFLYLRNARVMSTPVFFARTRITHVGFCFVQAFVVTIIFRVNNSDL
jgi:hypothetical protein